jgi:hypothetical protein
MRSGINILHASPIDATCPERLTLASNLPRLSQESEALYAVCVALQATISVAERSYVLESLHAALGKFRMELSRSTECLHDATLTAGLLLCSIGVRFYPTCHPNDPVNLADRTCRRFCRAFRGQYICKA